MRERLRIGVVGGGLIAQAVHLPNLAALDDRFELVAIADPSPTIAEGLAERFKARGFTEWTRLLDSEPLDALLVCSPTATHAPITLAALERGANVLVEKPLCIDPQDAATIAQRARASGRVVQVGYMKRFAPAYRAMLAALPASADRLRCISVLTYDPWMARAPFVEWDRMIHANDIPTSVVEQLRQAERDQVESATGRADERAVRAYSYTYLGCLIHDVNLVHGALDQLAVREPLRPVTGADWADGNAAVVTASLPDGVTVTLTWLLLPELMRFEERATLYFDDQIHELHFPAPYDRRAPVAHVVTSTQIGASDTRTSEHVGDPFLAELEHFHACITDGTPCACPPDQGGRDVELLRDLFTSTPRPLDSTLTTIGAQTT